MHTWHCDVICDITALINDVTSKNKKTHFRCGMSRGVLSENGHRTSGTVHLDRQVVCMTHILPHVFGHIPAIGAYNHFIYLHYFTILYTILQTHSYLTPQTQRSSTSDSLTCTSTTASIGDPSSRGVRHLGEQPSAVVLESDHGLSKVSHSSSPLLSPNLVSTTYLASAHLPGPLCSARALHP